MAALAAADAMLVVGSSLTVHSGLRYVRRAVSDGLPVVIVNRGATRGDALAVVKVDAGIDAEALDQAIGAAVTSADEMERELSGDPDSDEF